MEGEGRSGQTCSRASACPGSREQKAIEVVWAEVAVVLELLLPLLDRGRGEAAWVDWQAQAVDQEEAERQIGWLNPQWLIGCGCPDGQTGEVGEEHRLPLLPLPLVGAQVQPAEEEEEAERVEAEEQLLPQLRAPRPPRYPAHRSARWPTLDRPDQTCQNRVIRPLGVGQAWHAFAQPLAPGSRLHRQPQQGLALQRRGIRHPRLRR